MSKAKDDAATPDAPEPSKRMYRVTTSITGGHEPGELKSAADLAGCDVDWLVKTGALVPVDHVHAAKPGEVDLQDEIERLTAERAKWTATMGEWEKETAAFQKQIADLTAERDALRNVPTSPPGGDAPTDGAPPPEATVKASGGPHTPAKPPHGGKGK